MDEIVNINIADLTEHPLNRKIYCDVDDINSLVDSVNKYGVLEPLIITIDNVIISGHRRRVAALQAGLEQIPCIRTKIIDKLELEELVIQSNRQRVKSNEQIAREYQELKRIETEKAKMRMSSGGGDRKSEKYQESGMSNLTHPIDEIGKSRDIAARKLGIGSITAEKASKVVAEVDNLTSDGKDVEAKTLVDTLNKSVDRAYQRVKPARTPEQKEQDKINNRKVILRLDRLAYIVRLIEKVPEDLIKFIYRDLAKIYHPDKQQSVDLEISKQRTEAFKLIADVRSFMEIQDADDLRKLARIKGILKEESQRHD